NLAAEERHHVVPVRRIDERASIGRIPPRRVVCDFALHEDGGAVVDRAHVAGKALCKGVVVILREVDGTTAGASEIVRAQEPRLPGAVDLPDAVAAPDALAA